MKRRQLGCLGHQGVQDALQPSPQKSIKKKVGRKKGKILVHKDKYRVAVEKNSEAGDRRGGRETGKRKKAQTKEGCGSGRRPGNTLNRA